MTKNLVRFASDINKKVKSRLAVSLTRLKPRLSLQVWTNTSWMLIIIGSTVMSSLLCSMAIEKPVNGIWQEEPLPTISPICKTQLCNFIIMKKIRRRHTESKDPEERLKRLSLKVLIRDYNVRMSEVKLDCEYEAKLENLRGGLETPVNKLLLKERLDATYKIVFIELAEELHFKQKLADVLSPPTKRIRSAVFISTSKLQSIGDDIEYSIMDSFMKASVNTSFERSINKVHKRLQYMQKLVIFFFGFKN